MVTTNLYYIIRHHSLKNYREIKKKKKKWKKINIITGFGQIRFLYFTFLFFHMINPTIFTICKIILLSIANMFTRKNYK